jgi:hypothetical protein
MGSDCGGFMKPPQSFVDEATLYRMLLSSSESRLNWRATSIQQWFFEGRSWTESLTGAQTQL